MGTVIKSSGLLMNVPNTVEGCSQSSRCWITDADLPQQAVSKTPGWLDLHTNTSFSRRPVTVVELSGF